MRQSLLLGFTAWLIASASACNPVYYVPNTHNVPALQGRGDATFAAQGTALGLELQGAYAISNRLGLMVNAAGGSHEETEGNNPGSGSEVFLEAGLGTHHSFSTGRVVWENYALLGFGHVKNDLPWTLQDSPGTTGKIEADFVRFGIQPSLAWRSTYFDAIASLRALGLKHNKVSGNLRFDQTDQVAYLDGAGTQLVLEPALTVRAGRDPFKLSLQLSGSKNLTTEDFRQVETVIALGVVYSLRRPR